MERDRLRHLPQEFITFLPRLAIAIQLQGGDELQNQTKVLLRDNFEVSSKYDLISCYKIHYYYPDGLNVYAQWLPHAHWTKHIPLGRITKPTG